MAEKTGKVYLVGGGPGDAGLLTVKGMRLLEKAEVVVYDRLVGEGVLAHMPETAEKINVGKNSGNHPVPQDEINEILLQKALEGKMVVRLKGGDCFLFGRGGEELEKLSAGGVPFEVVPGVPSPVGGTAYAGIPLTHRDCCDSVHFITGHRKNNGSLSLDYEGLVKIGGTMVFMMSVATCGEIARGLMDAGMEKDMDCAVIENATRPNQRRFISTISQIEGVIRENKVISPALIVVGRVCRYADEFDWFGHLPLCGKRVLVTSPQASAGRLADKFRAQGADVTAFSCIKTVPMAFEIPDLRDCTAAVFTSAFGVETFFEALYRAGRDARCFAGVRVAVIGPGTAGALKRHGICADLIPASYDAETLAREMISAGLAGGRVVLLRARQGNPILRSALEEAGAAVENIELYDTLPVPYTGERPDTFDLVSFTSASAVESFLRSCAEADCGGVGALHALCIGEKTAQAARSAGMQVAVAREATLDSMIEYCLEAYQS